MDRPRQLWAWLVPLVLAAAGFGLVTSAATADGTDLRAGPVRLADLVRQQERVVAAQTRAERSLRARVTALTAGVASEEAPVAAARRRTAAMAGPAGLTPVAGPGVTVILDDAPRRALGAVAPGHPTPDDLVVHQQDVQGVVNALWVGGAEAMTLMGKRVVSTTAVRCVGNTLLLQGAVYSPPFTVAAIGDPARLRAALDADPAVSIFREYVSVYGLGYTVNSFTDRDLPAYDGPLDLRHVGA